MRARRLSPGAPAISLAQARSLGRDPVDEIVCAVPVIVIHKPGHDSCNDDSMRAKALWYVSAGRAELREEPVPAPQAGELQVRALFGAISRGTERLVHAGRVPASEHERMRAPFMGGAFPFPVKYGYATVGQVVAGACELADRVVFCLHPHQSLFNIPAAAAFPVPAQIPPSRAVLAANMETALNAVWDGAPGPADRIAVVGGGRGGTPWSPICARGCRRPK